MKSNKQNLWHMHKTFINAHAGVSSGVIGLQFGLRLHLHPYFVYASTKGPHKSGHMRRLIRAISAPQCD